jgi:hypothetical protein
MFLLHDHGRAHTLGYISGITYVPPRCHSLWSAHQKYIRGTCRAPTGRHILWEILYQPPDTIARERPSRPRRVCIFESSLLLASIFPPDLDQSTLVAAAPKAPDRPPLAPSVLNVTKNTTIRPSRRGRPPFSRPSCIPSAHSVGPRVVRVLHSIRSYRRSSTRVRRLNII